MQQYSLDIQRELPGNIALSVGYVGSRGTHLQIGGISNGGININQLPPQFMSRTDLTDPVPNPFISTPAAVGILSSPTVTRAQLLRPFPQFGDVITLGASGGNSFYNAVTVKAQKRLSRGFSLLTAYTFSKQLDNITGNSNAFSLGQRPMVVTGVDPGTSGSVSSRIDGYLNQAAFSPAAPNTFGNARRTIGVRSPNTRNWDISVLKNTMIVEGFTAQFRLEAVNAFNTPVFRAPNTQYGNPNFDRITSQANFARIVQMSVRLMW
jgi:hypothetical protein